MRFQSFVIFIHMYISCGFSSGCSENFLFIFSVQKFEFNIFLLLLLSPLLSLYSSCLGFAELIRYESWWFLFQQIWEYFGLYFIKYLSNQTTLSLSCSIINTLILLYQLLSLSSLSLPPPLPLSVLQIWSFLLICLQDQ